MTSAYGIFYEPYYTGQGGPLQSPISAPPYLQTQQISLTPTTFLNFPDPYFGNPPPDGTFATPLTNLTLAPNLPLPYSQDWDLNVQRSFGSDLLLEIGYVGTKGTKLPRFVEGNPAIYIPGFDSSGNPISTSGNADQRRLYSGCTLDPASPSVHLLVHRADRRHCQFFLQRARGEPDEALQSWYFVSRVVHVLEVH